MGGASMRSLRLVLVLGALLLPEQAFSQSFLLNDGVGLGAPDFCSALRLGVASV